MHKAHIITTKNIPDFPFSLTFFIDALIYMIFLHYAAQESYQVAPKEWLVEYTGTAFWEFLV